MGHIKSLFFDIQQDLETGRFSFQEIADRHQVPVSWVCEVHDEMMEYESQMANYITENDYTDDC